jgi:carbamoyltransferase
MMNILGISAFYHDSAACLIRDGKVIAAVQEERFTRKRHDASFPSASIQYCLRAGGIQSEDIDIIAFYEKPFLKFERLLKSYMTYAPMGVKSFVRSMPLWIKKKLWMKDFIAERLNFSKDIIFTAHHESHASSAFFASPYQEARF